MQRRTRKRITLLEWAIDWLEKQGEKSKGKSALEAWKDMRLEVYQQASGNRHEPNYSDDSTKMFSLNDIDEIIEKISEQSHNDKVEPKFKVGDLIKHDKANIIRKVISVNSGSYYVENIETNGKIELFNAEQNFHLWTIKDAKDGDVLVTTSIRNCPFIYRKTDYKNNLAYYYAGIDGNGDFCEGRTLYHFGPVSNVVPATKEQRDLLFSKMREAGYEWNAEKKELRKIEPKKLDPDKVIAWLNHRELSCEDVVTTVIPDDSPTSVPHRVKWLSDEFIKQFKRDFGL